MVAEADSSLDWTGRLVRLLVVFRTFVLLITIIAMPAAEHTLPVFAAVLAALAVSYVTLRYWDRIGPTVARHPAYLAFEMAIATVVLAAAGARSPFFYYTLGTGVLAGIVYGRPGAIPFSALLICAYELVELSGLPSLHPHTTTGSTLLAPLLYPVAVFAGIIAHDMVERGVEAELTLRERTHQLSAEQERLRVARELHDSLAKTVEGLAMSAAVLPRRCEKDPASAAELARGLARDAQQAAIEARLLMADLRPQNRTEQSLQAALQARAATFSERTGVAVEFDGEAGELGEQLAPEEIHELLRIVSEALRNAATHGHAREVRLAVSDDGDELRLSICDDGVGIGEAPDLERLKAAGHFGLAGMQERARSIGGELVVEPGPEGGTAVTVRLGGEAAGPAESDSPPAPPPRRPLRTRWRRRAAPVPSPTLRERA